jgi:hypothetical protein
MDECELILALGWQRWYYKWAPSVQWKHNSSIVTLTQPWIYLDMLFKNKINWGNLPDLWLYE